MGFSLSQIGDAGNNLLSAGTDITVAPFQSAANILQGKDPLAPYMNAIGSARDPLGLAAKKKNQDAAANSVADREALLAKIKGDTGLDQITRDELLQKASSGQDVTSIYADALLGKGIYGNRRANEQYAKLLSDTPGQKQLFLSNQQRTAAGQSMFNPIGTQAGPLLTGGQR